MCCFSCDLAVKRASNDLQNIYTTDFGAKHIAASDADSDPSVPLSAPDLRLHSRSVVIKFRIRSCIRSCILSQLPTFSTAVHSVSTTNALLGLLSPGGDGEIRTIVDGIRAKSWEHVEKKEVFRCVQVGADLVQRLGTVGDGSGAHLYCSLLFKSL